MIFEKIWKFQNGGKINARRVLSLILPVVKGDNLLLKLRGKNRKI